MADYTATPNYAFKMPTDHANTNTWGGYNNGNWSSVDGLIGSVKAQVNAQQVILTRTNSVEADVIFNGLVGTSKLRWAVGIDTSTETGSPVNTGSNFHINRFDDNGNLIDSPLAFFRSTGAAYFADAVNMGGTLGVAGAVTANGLANYSGFINNQASGSGSVGYQILNNTGAFVGTFAWNPSNIVEILNATGGASVNLNTDGSVSTSGAFHTNNMTTTGLTVNGATVMNGNMTTTGLTVNGNITGTGVATFSGACQAHGMFECVQTSGDYGYYTYNSGVTETGFFGQRSSDGGYGFFTAYSPFCNVYVDLGGSFFYQGGTGNAYKVSGTTWAAYSDERIKTVTGEYGKGLSDILQLRPVTYTYKGNDTPSADVDAVGGGKTDAAPYPASMHYSAAKDGTEFVGLIAQEVEGIFPDMVDKIAGYIDGQAVTDIRTLNVGNLFFALVNCCKELAAKNDALAARIEALEAAR